MTELADLTAVSLDSANELDYRASGADTPWQMPQNSFQPATGNVDRGAESAVQRALARHAGRPGALLPVLHDVQDALGHVPPSAVPEVADALNLSRAEVHGVVTYYHHFRAAPAGRHRVQVCRAEACQAMGADALLAHAQQRLGCGVHGTSADGRFSLDAAFCLGLCASSPAIVVDDAPHARVTPAVFDALIEPLRAGGTA